MYSGNMCCVEVFVLWEGLFCREVVCVMWDCFFFVGKCLSCGSACVVWKCLCCVVENVCVVYKCLH